MNPLLGDKVVEVGGVSYVARPDFEALARIEETGSLSLVEILGLASQRRLKISDVVRVIYHCVLSGCAVQKTDPPTMKQLGESMRLEGFSSFVTMSMELVAEMYHAGSTEKKTVRANQEETPSLPVEKLSGDDSSKPRSKK